MTREMTTYLVRNKGTKRVAHIWLSERKDTACKMWSTGGLKKTNYVLYDESALGFLEPQIKVCNMCQVNIKKG